jgi:hypothetical protein
LIDDGICDAESAPSVSSINRIVRNKAQQCITAALHHHNGPTERQHFQGVFERRTSATKCGGGGTLGIAQMAAKMPSSTMGSRKQQKLHGNGEKKVEAVQTKVENNHPTTTTGIKEFGSDEESHHNHHHHSQQQQPQQQQHSTAFQQQQVK